MFGAGQIRVDDAATALGIDLGVGELIEEAVSLGYNPGSARQAMRWTVGRIALHAGIQHVSEITNDHIIEVLEAIRLFSERADLSYFYPSAQNYRDNAAKQWITHLHQMQVVLFHRGQVATQPRKLMPSWKPPPVLPPQMQAVADKWLAARRLTDAPATVEKLEIAIRRFGEWLTEHAPSLLPGPRPPSRRRRGPLRGDGRVAARGFATEQGWAGDAGFWEIFEHTRRLRRAIQRLTGVLTPGSAVDEIAGQELTDVQDAWRRPQEMQTIYVALLEAVAKTQTEEEGNA
ncbi:MAG: hypothetical protein DLM61_15115 [Pseudonocardiales bacterium]|nr:MAG: hypothetical protein DLM61_15115 [Pseudonocardiales bacterium]